MLALTRRSGEKIVVIDKETGERMIIIVRVQGSQVRESMEASSRFDIFRKERLERQQAAAAD